MSAFPIPTQAIQHFRAEHGLDDAFALHAFASKDWAGLATLEQASQPLHGLRTELLSAASHSDGMSLLHHCETLVQRFFAGLSAINPHIGLNRDQLEFAVAGLSDALRAYAYAQLKAHISEQAAPLPAQVYREWLRESFYVQSTIHPYQHPRSGATWQVRVFGNIYGRQGLAVTLPDATLVYVLDPHYHCPAAAWMEQLFLALVARF